MKALDVAYTEFFKEVIELNEWVKIINVLDSALETGLWSHQGLILVFDRGGPPKPRHIPSDSATICSAIERVNFAALQARAV